MTAVANAVPPPFGDAIAQMPRPGMKQDPLAGLVGKAWADWFRNLLNVNERCPARVAAVQLQDQHVSIAATDMTGGGQFSAGLYRISWNLRCVGSGNLGDTVEIQFAWTDRGPRTYTGASLDLAAVVRPQENEKRLLVRIQGLTPITYTITYVSPGEVATYDLDIVIEEVLA